MPQAGWKYCSGGVGNSFGVYPKMYIALQRGGHMKSLVVKRSIVIAGHKTSVSLEEPFWQGLKEIAQGQHLTLSTMVGDIDTRRRQGNLSSAIRLFVLDSVRGRASGLNGTRPATDLRMQEST
jgi:predicted DNA-binding ribbon-helix-helix protein